MSYVAWTDQQWLDGVSGQTSREVWDGLECTSRQGPKKGQNGSVAEG